MKMLCFGDLKPQKGLPYSRAHYYRLIESGSFPKPIKFGNRVAFLEPEIDAWIAARITERDEREAA